VLGEDEETAMDVDDPVREMTSQECWDFLASEELGRLAYRLLDELYIVPVNYAVDGRTLLFRTNGGNKLFSIELGTPVAFEVDRIVGETALSVVVRGRARRLEELEEQRADQVPLHTWIDTPKYFVVEVSPEEVTGREIALHRPWRHLRQG
jgi:nitroimidazol reductase NimA-like FMN-containing flavoprotein (pyridoxamine 5'-phosphate oxidase superfamily)